MRKIQLGCGSNRLQGWENYDIDVDITRPLPFESNSTDIIFCEHCIEHIEYEECQAFLSECHRSIKDGGILRLTTPCLDKIISIRDEEYIRWCNDRFSRRLPTFGNMMNTMFRSHGHKYIYDRETLETMLRNSNFRSMTFFEPGESGNDELKGLEHHWRKIGEKFNSMESMAVEAVKKEGKY